MLLRDFGPHGIIFMTMWWFIHSLQYMYVYTVQHSYYYLDIKSYLILHYMKLYYHIYSNIIAHKVPRIGPLFLLVVTPWIFV
jgi:hypothetical protein